MEKFSIVTGLFSIGMPPNRYMGVLMILIEIAALLLWHFWREHMERAIPVLCVIVTFIVPWINRESLSIK